MRHFLSPHAFDECCPDPYRRPCKDCVADIADKLAFLAHNLSVAAALCHAYRQGHEEACDKCYEQGRFDESWSRT